MIEVKHTDYGSKGVFCAFEGDTQVGEMSYVLAGEGCFIIDHTKTFAGHEGKGVGKRLVLSAVEYARSSGKKILPLCTFAKHLLSGKEEYADVLGK